LSVSRLKPSASQPIDTATNRSIDRSIDRSRDGAKSIARPRRPPHGTHLLGPCHCCCWGVVVVAVVAADAVTDDDSTPSSSSSSKRAAGSGRRHRHGWAPDVCPPPMAGLSACLRMHVDPIRIKTQMAVGVCAVACVCVCVCVCVSDPDRRDLLSSSSLKRGGRGRSSPLPTHALTHPPPPHSPSIHSGHSRRLLDVAVAGPLRRCHDRPHHHAPDPPHLPPPPPSARGGH
jgi:hypothetical protein